MVGTGEQPRAARAESVPAAWRPMSTSPPPDSVVHDAIDAAYHTKYDRYGPRIVGTVVGPAADVTIRLIPQANENTFDRSTS